MNEEEIDNGFYGILHDVEKYEQTRERHRYEEEKRKAYAEQQEYRLQQQIDNNFYERLRHLVDIKQKEPKVLTYEEKMNMKNFSLAEIIRLTDALSLSISNSDEREAFDTIVKNWRDDRIKEIK